MAAAAAAGVATHAIANAAKKDEAEKLEKSREKTGVVGSIFSGYKSVDETYE